MRKLLMKNTSEMVAMGEKHPKRRVELTKMLTKSKNNAKMVYQSIKNDLLYITSRENKVKLSKEGKGVVKSALDVLKAIQKEMRVQVSLINKTLNKWNTKKK